MSEEGFPPQLTKQFDQLADEWSTAPDAALAITQGRARLRRRRALWTAEGTALVAAVAAGSALLLPALTEREVLQPAGPTMTGCPQLVEQPLEPQRPAAEIAALLPQQDIERVVQYLDDAQDNAGPGPSFAFAPDGTPVVQVGFLREPCEQAARLSEVLEEPNALRVFGSTASREDSRRVLEAIQSGLSRGLAPGTVSSLRTDPRTGQVEVGLFEDTESSRAAVENLVPSGLQNVLRFAAGLAAEVESAPAVPVPADS